MVRRMSKQRKDLLDLLRESGPQSPATAAPLLGCSRKAAATLLYSCLESHQVVALGEGLYDLPQEEKIAAQDETIAARDETIAATIAAQDETIAAPESASEMEETSEEMPILGESKSGIYVYSSTLNAMIPNEEHRRNKGYR
jgi:hypothetical protein